MRERVPAAHLADWHRQLVPEGNRFESEQHRPNAFKRDRFAAPICRGRIRRADSIHSPFTSYQRPEAQSIFRGPLAPYYGMTTDETHAADIRLWAQTLQDADDNPRQPYLPKWRGPH